MGSQVPVSRMRGLILAVLMVVVESHPSSLSLPVSGLSSKLVLSMDQTRDPGQNLIISPVSIFLALSLLYHGSDLSTKTELENFLELDSRVNSGMATKALLLDYARSRKTLNTTIQLANGVFADYSLGIKTPYKKALKYLSSGVGRVDFTRQSQAAGAINNWVSNKTNNLITDLVSPGDISGETRLMLLNAVYFKANWKNQFSKHRTRKSVRFEVTDDSEVLVDMMFRSDDILYQSDPTLQAHVVSLPYEDENFQMMIFLPRQQDQNSLQSIIQQFPDTDFNRVYRSLRVRPVDLSLPSFTVDFKSELVSALRRNGVKSMFNPDQADFSLISDQPLRVSNILHQAKVEVNEEGSEAAAVTGVFLDLRSFVEEEENIVVNFNRPFIFVIHDRKHNIPLFIGKVVNPSSETPRRRRLTHSGYDAKYVYNLQ